MSTSGLRQLAGRLAAVFREMDEAQRRMLVVRTALDRYMENPDDAPETYAEFLVRTSGALVREPSARARQERVRRTRGPQAS